VILRLAGKDYAETSRSVALPLLNAEIATAFLGGSFEQTSTEWLKRVREWARSGK
jgi:hypothetical protein